MNTYYVTEVNAFFKNHFVSISYAIVVFVVSVSISQFIINAEYDQAQVKAKIATAYYANTLKTKVDRELNALLSVSNGLSSYLTVYHQELKAEKIKAMLADMYMRTKHVRNLGIAVGYKITYLHPLESNEKAMGIDFRDLPKQWPQVKQAIASQQGVLIGPVDLVQGGRGLIYRYPVFINGEYWGLLSTVINIDSFFKAAFSHLRSDAYQFAIRIKDSPEVFFGEPSLFQHPKVYITDSDFPQTKWEWAILQNTPSTFRLIMITRVMGVAISLLLAALTFFFLKERRTLTTQAMQDSLTGLANRRLFDLRFAQTFAQSKRFKLNMAIMVIDVDHFKKLNDTYGHDAGDEVIKQVAKKLNDCIRKVDTLARVGGDEFVILLDTIKDLDDVSLVANKIIGLFGHDLLVLGHSIKITLSIGIAVNSQHKDESVKSLMKKADMALYEAKGAGRNGYYVYQEPT